MSILSDEAAVSFLKGLTYDNFFQQIASLEPDNAELQESIKEVTEELNSETGAAAFGAGSGVLKVGAASGQLWFSVGKVKGKGACEKKGAGGFKGSPPSLVPGITDGTYNAYFNRATCKIELANGVTYHGIGLQKGLSNRNGQPWTGTWKV